MATTATIMICSTCGGKLHPELIEGLAAPVCVEEATHTCPTCGAIWDETNGWVEVGNLLIPYTNAMIKWRRQRRAVR